MNNVEKPALELSFKNLSPFWRLSLNYFDQLAILPHHISADKMFLANHFPMTFHIIAHLTLFLKHCENLEFYTMGMLE